ncbi:hypothetical protein NADFUDRAFT_48895 [Nadsonia fulvescens var. elongata DSM 6958]|uniref:Uncharacterized protein n=1 Tax=Nadsonia fulvescens var. elongata DSM 6958 TaxID=857566 RepID=A0A1E3PS33_9ASCO|nr:hypothetical protein NADFUDRAFT_48895 [Nadsonia fulvescens var. elongata DSM 6958]
MFRLAIRRAAAPRFVRSFTSSVVRPNAISDIYIREVKGFKPTPATAADAEAGTKPWAAPAAPAAPSVEAEGVDALASYEQSAVETESGSSTGAKEEEWFVEEVEEEEHH